MGTEWGAVGTSSGVFPLAGRRGKGLERSRGMRHEGNGGFSTRGTAYIGSSHFGGVLLFTVYVSSGIIRGFRLFVGGITSKGGD